MVGRVLFILGGVAFMLGLIFMAQGAGMLAWPANNVMYGVEGWIWRGGAVALIGLGIMLIARRRTRGI